MTKCKDCKYSLVNDGKRRCLRFPPTTKTINTASNSSDSIYPVVEDNWRCGEGATE